MSQPPAEAQRQIREELSPALERKGFALADEQPGHLAYRVSLRPGFGLGVSTLVAPFFAVTDFLVRLGRRVAGQRVEFDLVAETAGSQVEVYDRGGRHLSDMVGLLGRQGHWPANERDQDWDLDLLEDGDLSWIDDVDLETADRITRRAVERARRRRD
jgi:hypothetical protein